MEHYDVKPVDGLDVQLGLLLAMLEDGTREWRGELGEVSEDALVWQPFVGGHSVGGVLLHIADVEAFWVQQVAAGRQRDPEELKRLLSEETDQYGVRWPAPPRRPLAWFLKQHDAVRARTREVAGELGDPARACTRKAHTFTLRWIFHHVLTHEAYHGGQAVLLSLMHGRH